MKTNDLPNACTRKDDLLDYLYDEMTAAARAGFDQHLSACAGCRDELHGLERLRRDLCVWEVSAAPHIEVVLPRTPATVLRELLSLFPAWVRATTALAGAAALVLIAFGVMSLLSRFHTAPASAELTATKNTSNQTPITVAAPPAQTTLTPELKALLAAEVAKAMEQERKGWRTQLAAAEARHKAQRQQLLTVAQQLRTLQARHEELAAEQRPSIRRLFVGDYADGSGAQQ